MISPDTAARNAYVNGKSFRDIWKMLKKDHGLETVEAKRVAKDTSPAADAKRARASSV